MTDLVAESARRHYATVYRFVRRRVETSEEAFDLTQDVFEAAAQALADERLDEEPTLAWLYTVARRRLIRTWRQRFVTQPLDDDTPGPAGINASYGANVLNEIVEGLKRLPEDQRRVVVMKLLEGRSFVEIARQLGVSEEACRQRLSRGLASLREDLRKKGVTP
jgi:RNA polymerase sigma-70 factor (ECF subfamily)